MLKQEAPQPGKLSASRHKHSLALIMTQIVLEHQVVVPEIRVSDEYEIDGVEDTDFGTLYRLWKGWNLLGTFYQDLEGKWVAQPSLYSCEKRFNTAPEAQQEIISRSGLLL